MSQFRKADSSVYTTFLDLIEQVFPELTGYSFGLLYREKIKKSRGGVILAEICQPSKLLSYFAKNDAGNPFDFLIIVDEMAWCCAKETDRIRIIRHELRHINMSDKGVARLIGHDFEDFYAEVDLNADDPSWGQKLVEVVVAGYDQVKAGERDPRTEHQGADGVEPVTKDPVRQTQLPIESKPEDDGELPADSKRAILEASVKSSKTYIGRGKDNNPMYEEDVKAAVNSGVSKSLDDLARDNGLIAGDNGLLDGRAARA